MHKELTGRIVHAAIQVHRELGPGLLESTYEQCLMHLLVQGGAPVICQEELPIRFQGILIDAGYRVDMLVDNKVIVELKAVQHIEPIHEAQLLTYLRLSGIRVGLLMNFNVLRMRDGIKRFAQ
ncbi:GxxExxY protein [Planctomycetales bacterium ZRK34]|nr:GxxExxY protein [Planctomycetales bacterium ZRK34]